MGVPDSVIKFLTSRAAEGLAVPQEELINLFEDEGTKAELEAFLSEGRQTSGSRPFEGPHPRAPIMVGVSSPL